MKRISASVCNLVRAYAVEAFHEQVAEFDGEQTPLGKRKIDPESGIGFKPLHGRGDHRDIFQPCLFQRPAEEADIVGSAAAAARL